MLEAWESGARLNGSATSSAVVGRQCHDMRLPHLHLHLCRLSCYLYHLSLFIDCFRNLLPSSPPSTALRLSRSVHAALPSHEATRQPKPDDKSASSTPCVSLVTPFVHPGLLSPCLSPLSAPPSNNSELARHARRPARQTCNSLTATCTCSATISSIRVCETL